MDYDSIGRVNYSDMNFHYMPILASNTKGFIPLNTHTRSHVTLLYEQFQFEAHKQAPTTLYTIDVKNCDENDF